MGLLARLGSSNDDDSPEAVLHLRPRGMKMPKDVQRAAERLVAEEIGRRWVFGTRIQSTQLVTELAIYAVASVIQTGEEAASRIPEERGDIDATRRIGTMVINQQLSELAQ